MNISYRNLILFLYLYQITKVFSDVKIYSLNLRFYFEYLDINQITFYQVAPTDYYAPIVSLSPNSSSTYSDGNINPTLTFITISPDQFLSYILYTILLSIHSPTYHSALYILYNRILSTETPIIGTPYLTHYYTNYWYHSNYVREFKTAILIPFTAGNSSYPMVTIRDVSIRPTDVTVIGVEYSNDLNGNSFISYIIDEKFGVMTSTSIIFSMSINNFVFQIPINYYKQGNPMLVQLFEYYPTSPTSNVDYFYSIATVSNIDGLRLEFSSSSTSKYYTFPVYSNGDSITYLCWGNTIDGTLNVNLRSFFSNSPQVLESFSIQNMFISLVYNLVDISVNTIDLRNKGIGILLTGDLGGGMIVEAPIFKFFKNNFKYQHPFPFNDLYYGIFIEIYVSEYARPNFNLTYQLNGQVISTTGRIPNIIGIDNGVPELIGYWLTVESIYVILHMEILDYISGFFRLHYLVGENEFFLFDNSNLVSGDINNGTYQYKFTIGTSDLLYQNLNFLIYDIAGNCFSFTYSPFIGDVLDNNLYQLTSQHITSFIFNIDNNQHIGNLSLQLLYPSNNYIVGFTPNFSPTIPTQTYYGVYNNVTNSYNINFTIPSTLVTGDFFNDKPYLIQINGILIPSHQIIPFHPTTATLNVYNPDQFADEIPPIVISIKPSTSSIINLTPATSYPVTLGFNIIIHDPVNGFKNGTITISNGVERGYKFMITPDNLIIGDQFTGTYLLEFNLTTWSCNPSIYSIREIELWDNGNHVSSKKLDKIVTPIDPFMMFNGMIPSIGVQCQSQNSSLTLTNFTISNSWINMNSPYRSLTMYLDIRKDDGIPISNQNNPIIFFNTVNGVEIDYCESVVSNIINSTFYQYECIHEFKKGFGASYDITLSIYGLSSLPTVFGLSNTTITSKSGYSTSQLYNMNISPLIFPYYIQSKSKFDRNPIIGVVEPISSNETILTIYGLNFFIGSNSNIQMDFTNDENGYISSGIKRIIHKNTGNLIVELNNPQYFSFMIRIVIGNRVSNEYEVIPIQLSTPSPSIPKYCTTNTQCSKNGICLVSSGICQCNDGWTSQDCSSRLIIIPQPTPNKTNPTAPIDFKENISGEGTISIQSLVSIQGINEVDYKGNSINNIEFSQWSFKSIEFNQTKQYLYNSTISKNGIITNINVQMEWFSTKTMIQFANTNITMNPSTIKYTIKLDKYQFSSPLNFLQVVFKASIQDNSIIGKSKGETCSFQEFGNNKDTLSDYIKLQVNDHSLYGRFIKRAIIDNQIKSVTTKKIINSNDNENSRNDISESLIAVLIPSYSEYVVIDPDFGLVADIKPASAIEGSSCSEISNGLSKSQIAGIAIAGFVFIASTIVSFIFYRKLKTKRLAEDKRIEMLVSKMLSNEGIN